MKEMDIKSITDIDIEKNKVKTIDSYTNDNYKRKTNWNLIIIIIIIFIIALVAIGLLFTLMILNKKKKKDDSNDNNNNNEKIEIEKLNFNEYQNISSTYLVFKNQVFMAFNPDNIGLESSDFSIKFENQGSARLLSIGESIDGQIKSNINGKIKLTIIIKKQIDSLNGLFKMITNLQSIDLSGLYMNKIINYDSLFDGCSSLEEVKFPINTFSENVISMNDMFKECISLNFVNLTSFKITEKTSMNDMFYRCKNLQKVDISSFNFINAGFFNGINSGVNIIFNSYLSDRIKNITNTLGLKINLLMNGLIQK